VYHSEQARQGQDFSQPAPKKWLIAGLSTAEWGRALAVALLAIALTLIPYLLGYATAQEGMAFTGLLMNPEDSQTYWAKMQQGYDGRLLYTIPFTPETHPGAFVGAFYLGTGHLARLSGLSLPLMWHVSRLAADVLLFLVVFGFIAAFITDSRGRWLAYLLSLFGSGLGWLLFLLAQPYWLGAFPVDFKQPGAHLFFTALTFPHVALGTAILLLSVWLLYRAGEQSAEDGWHGWRYAVAAGCSNVILGIAYPFLLYLIMLMAVLYWLYLAFRMRQLLWRPAFLFAVTFAIPAPLYLYYAYTLKTNLIFRAWDAQAITPSPPWPHYLIAYGPMLLLGFWHWRGRPQQRRQFAVLWLWIFAVALLVYAPLTPQRRFVQGVQAPLAILATAGFLQVALPWLERTRLWQALLTRPRYSAAGLRRFVTVLFLTFMSLSNLYVLASVSVSAVIQQPDPLFRPQDEVEATEWLRQNGIASAVVLGAYQTGNYVAAHARQRVVLGHWAETMAYEDKVTAVATFYDATTSDAWRRELLAQYNVTYVWHGPRERELGGFEPAMADYLQPVYLHNTVAIYAVRP
jgi:hypothetical protein